MNRNIVPVIVILILLHAKAYSQPAKPLAPVKTGNEWKMPSDVFQRATTYSSGLQKKLGLDSVQTKKVYALFLANTKPLDEIAVAAVTDGQKAAMRKSNRLVFDEKIKAILSAAQYRRYSKL